MKAIISYIAFVGVSFLVRRTHLFTSYNIFMKMKQPAKKLLKSKTKIMYKIALSVMAIFFATTILAQGGKVGINTTTPFAMLHVKDSSVLFQGRADIPATPGNPPISGQGVRMMWYPDKAAFRVGRVSSFQWNKDSVGNFSFASSTIGRY